MRGGGGGTSGVDSGAGSSESGGKESASAGAGGASADGGTDFKASERTSTVSRRSAAKLVIAKSRVFSRSRAELRWRFRKSACK